MTGCWIRPASRLAIYLRDGGRCLYCGAAGWGVTWKQVAPLSLDHVVPRSQGGSNRPDNLITACVDCNAERQALGLVDWLWVLHEQGRLWVRADIAEERIRRHMARDLGPYREEARALLEEPPAWWRYQKFLSSKHYRDVKLSGQGQHALEAMRKQLMEVPF